MKHGKIEAGACDTGPNENCVSTAQAYSKKPLRNQVAGVVLVQKITGDIGPVHVLTRRGCEDPSVVVETHATKALVYLTSPPWGWGNQLGEFLDPASPAVLRYAQRLALKLREAALIEQGRRVRNRELAQREREAMLASRGGGK